MREPTPRDPRMAKIEISIKVTRPEAYSNELLVSEAQERVVELTREEIKPNIELLAARVVTDAVASVGSLKTAIHEESAQKKHAHEVAAAREAAAATE